MQNINLMLIFELTAIVVICLLKLFELRWRKVNKLTNIFKRALNNLTFFNLSNTVLSISLINWRNVSIVEIGFMSFQVILTIIQVFMICIY